MLHGELLLSINFVQFFSALIRCWPIHFYVAGETIGYESPNESELINNLPA